MFRQIAVDEPSQRYQAILWRPDGSSELKTYFLTTVTYGLACSPYLANRVIRQLANDYKNSHPIASRVLQEEFYVDDCLSGDHTLNDAQKKVCQLFDLTDKGKFPLRKWSTNNHKILSSIPSEYLAHEPKNLKEINDVVSVLGLSWRPNN
ncbi:unnamed protein product [Trichogramma brassicae]|uniref:Reverse transcriptase domain-containing protein n=1 Tax=Trichogramma brassicae TaxID=86971 RepID=A0A6H5HY33_9HYME|nr:unnamed protein product [Trichogramma brassicae]